MREGAFFHADEEHDGVFEALGCVQGHEGDGTALLAFVGQLVGVGDECHGFEESRE